MVNYEKSSVYFSPNVPTNLKEQVCENLGIPATTNIGKYLGFSLRHRGAPRNQINLVAERVISKKHFLISKVELEIVPRKRILVGKGDPKQVLFSISKELKGPRLTPMLPLLDSCEKGLPHFC